MKRLLKKKDAYVLTWILTFFLIVAMLSVTTISFAVLSTQSSYIQHNRRQAQYTAKSAVLTTVDYISKNSSNASALSKLMQSTGTGSFEGMGEYSVDVSYANPSHDRIKVSATANYMGQTFTTSAYLYRPPSLSGLIPTDNVIYVNNPESKSNAALFGQSNLFGNVYINDNFKLGAGSKISGHVVVNGTTEVVGAANTTLSLFSFDSVVFGNSGEVAGDVRTLQNLTMNGNARIYANAYADGILIMNEPDGSAQIQGDALIGGNVNFAGLDDGHRVRGILRYGGTVRVPAGKTLSKFVINNEKISNYIPIDPSAYTAPPALPVFLPPEQNILPELYTPLPSLSSSNLIISRSGTITNSFIDALKNWPINYGSTVIIDATNKDIHLRLHDTILETGNGINFEVKTNGEHNAFIYLSGNSAIKIGSNQYMGMNGNRNAAPYLFIFGDAKQTVYIEANSGLNACVYIPNGRLYVRGSALTGLEKLTGLCIAGEVDIDSNVSFRYSKPPLLEDTDLNDFQTGSWNSSSPWAIGSWGE